MVRVRVRVRVSSRVRVSVSFNFFIAFSALRCMLKDRKLTLGLAALIAQWLRCFGCNESVRVRIPAWTVIFATFFEVFFKVFCKLRLGLVLALRLVLGLR